MLDRFSRTQLVFGKEAMDRLKATFTFASAWRKVKATEPPLLYV